jgi:rhodanese-related sulfurtransferase
VTKEIMTFKLNIPKRKPWNLFDDINNIYKCGKISYEFRKIFGNKEKIYIFYCDKGAMSLVICEKMSGLGYICKTVVGGFEAYKGMCVIN